MDKLQAYRGKRDAVRTPEPCPRNRLRRAENPDGGAFVIQEHHARRLHWDVRLERDGVLVSWALPKGVPDDPAVNHLAVHTEDHPLEYGELRGGDPARGVRGRLGTIWDSGRYETLKWAPNEVKVRLHGRRVSGEFALFQTRGQPVDDPPRPPAAAGRDCGRCWPPPGARRRRTTGAGRWR